MFFRPKTARRSLRIECVKDFRNLAVWEKSHHLTLAVYKATQRFPKEEQYALTNQLRRAAISIPANIAEGCGKGSDAEFARYLQIALGSASELEYHHLLAKDLEYLILIDYQPLEQAVIEVKRMLTRLIHTLHPTRYDAES